MIQALEIAPEWFDKIESGVKKITIRKSRRAYVLGKLILFNTDKQWCKEVNITNTQHIELKNVPEEAIKADGFKDLEDLKDKLSEYYGVVPDDEIMTIIKWG